MHKAKESEAYNRFIKTFVTEIAEAKFSKQEEKNRG